jgi:hypothetical protein
MNPEVLLRNYYAAMNAGDAETAIAQFANDAIRKDISIAASHKVVTGKAGIAAGIQARIADNIHIEARNFQVAGNKVTCTASVSTDYGRRLGFAPIEETAEIIIEAGKIQIYTVELTPESVVKVQAAEAECFKSGETGIVPHFP